MGVFLFDSSLKTLARLSAILCLCAAAVRGEESTASAEVASSPDETPLVEAWNTPPQGGVKWGGVLAQSGLFAGVSHAFRLAKESGTREGMGGPFFKTYKDSVTNMHGWADGDEFYVNYVGHPMEGAVAAYIWVNNDPRFNRAEFGMNRYYWKSRLRALAWSAAHSEQFELGFASEASIGKIQRVFPQQGFVDEAVTPTVGFAWMLAEDALDKYVIKRIEARYRNPYVLLLVRSWLNPSRSFANAMAFKLPWNRTARPGVFSGQLQPFLESQRNGQIRYPSSPPPNVEGEYGVANFEFTFGFQPQWYFGGTGACVGGGGEMAFKMSRDWQFIAGVNGCKIMNLEKDLTGDSLSYMVGPRWTPRSSSAWSPYAQVLVGGTKIAQERMFPDLKASLIDAAGGDPAEMPVHDQYTVQYDMNNFSLAVAGGVDYRFTRAIALRMANVEYKYTWGAQAMNGTRFDDSLAMTVGLILRTGTW